MAGPRTHHCCYSASQEGLLLSLSSRAHGKFFKMQRWTPFFKKSVFQLVNKGHNSKKLILISFVHLKPKLTTSKMAEFHLESSLPTKINKTATIWKWRQGCLWLAKTPGPSQETSRNQRFVFVPVLTHTHTSANVTNTKWGSHEICYLNTNTDGKTHPPRATNCEHHPKAKHWNVLSLQNNSN